MDEQGLEERVVDLKRDLHDGDDLGQAISLIGDALQRRMLSVNETLEELQNGHDLQPDTDLHASLGKLRDTISRYRGDLERRRERIESLISAFDDTLEETAQRLSEIEDAAEA